MCFFIFIVYAGIDVYLKIREHSKYNMELLLKDIKKLYPHSVLTFQNIKIESNNSKLSVSHNGGSDSYFEETYIYIRDGKLRKERSYMFVMVFFFLPVLMLVFFHGDPRVKKVKDLHTISMEALQWIAFSLLAAIVILVFSINPYEYRTTLPLNDFEVTTSDLVEEVDLNKYKKVK